MSVYKTGTVSVTNGSQVVTGANTLWLTNIEPGDAFTIASSGMFYDVASVDSDTQITLSANYAGPTVSGKVYVIARDFTPLNNIPELRKGDIETAAIFTRAMRRIDQRLSANQDAGALTSAGVYEDTVSGIAGTNNGEYFFVPEADEFVLYLNSSGTASEQLRFASLATALQYAQDAAQAATDAQNAADSADGVLTTVQGLETDFIAYRDQSQASASTATTSASSAEQSATSAEQDADRAEAAADVATTSATVYPDTATGLANTVDQDYFSVVDPDSNVYISLYKNEAGTATLVGEYPSRSLVESLEPRLNQAESDITSIEGRLTETEKLGTMVVLASNDPYVLPSTPVSGQLIRLIKEDSYAPTVEASAGDSILIKEQSLTSFEFDIDQELLVRFNGSVWEVLNV